MNEVTNFMHYMFGKWSLTESRRLFGDSLGEHIWEKWNDTVRKGCGDQLLFYSNIDSECKQKLVDRANELYGKGPHIKVGSMVIYKGCFGLEEPSLVRVIAIEQSTREREKYGKPVDSVPFKERNFCTFDLDNGHWCYGEQITHLVNP